jgi:hypothetical protein
VGYSDVKTPDLWEEDMTTTREIQIENIRSLQFHDIREGMTLKRVIL